MPRKTKNSVWDHSDPPSQHLCEPCHTFSNSSLLLKNMTMDFSSDRFTNQRRSFALLATILVLWQVVVQTSINSPFAPEKTTVLKQQAAISDASSISLANNNINNSNDDTKEMTKLVPTRKQLKGSNGNGESSLALAANASVSLANASVSLANNVADKELQKKVKSNEGDDPSSRSDETPTFTSTNSTTNQTSQVKKATSVIEPTPSSLQLENGQSCTWAPDSDSECRQLLSSLLCSSSSTYHGNNTLLGRRLLLLGDSTMHMLYKHSPISSILEQAPVISSSACNRYNCTVATGRRCENNEMFGLEYPNNKTWTLPQKHVEGPKAFGLKKPFCSDCVSDPLSVAADTYARSFQSALTWIGAVLFFHLS